jgi:phosphoribosyl 1,2-cyclic phosphate phosphodiesterase
VLGLPSGNLLIDTPPELRIQLIREGLGLIHAVAYTHAHADHLFGLDDLRIFPRYLGHEMPIYCEPEVERAIRQAFAYAFDPVAQQFPAGGVPKLVFHPIGVRGATLEVALPGSEPLNGPVEVLGAAVTPIRLWHGPMPILGYRVGNVAYCTDVNRIPPESMAQLQGLEVLILDALRREPHVTHFGLDEAVAVARQLAPKRTFFTHIAHRLEHEATNRTLPPGMELAYDGLAIPLGEEIRISKSEIRNKSQ